MKNFQKNKTPTEYRPDLLEWLKTKAANQFSDEDKEWLIEAFHLQGSGKIYNDTPSETYTKKPLGNLHLSKCYSCDEYALWLNFKLLWPEQNTVFYPKEKMPEDAKAIYLEAASLFGKSPRPSAALLRLSIEHLCNSLNGKELNINKGIAALVKKGLNERTQKALDIVRVTGNDAVHPGQININDNPEIAEKLFKLVNVIVEELISLPAEIDSLYDGLPETKKEAIVKRDGKN